MDPTKKLLDNAIDVPLLYEPGRLACDLPIGCADQRDCMDDQSSEARKRYTEYISSGASGILIRGP